MSGRRRKIMFTGLLQQNVLGTFPLIRGFADLRDLADVSKPIPYEGGSLGGGIGYQRAIDEDHVEAIKRFLQRGRYRFFPEVVLSLRSTGASDLAVAYKKRRTSKSDNGYVVRVDLQELASSVVPLITRIDGNHRLEAARRLADDQKRSASFKDFATAPFCFVVLNSGKPEEDALAEAMLFNLINSKALPIVSEHSLAVLMGDSGSAGERFDEDPHLYLTRAIRDRVQEWPGGFFEALGNGPLTRLHSTARVLLRPPGLDSSKRAAVEGGLATIFDPLYDLAARLRATHERFVLSPTFLPIAAEVYLRHTLVEGGGTENEPAKRSRRAETWLRDFARWFQRLGVYELPAPSDPTVLWAIFKRDWDRRPKSVFLALSFREDNVLKDVGTAMREAIGRFNAGHPNCPLKPIRVDEQRGESYEIPGRVFEDIEQSSLVIADLTDERQNVYCEVGYAMSRRIPFILTFHKRAPADDVPWDRKDVAGNRVHFDLAAFRHLAYDNPLNLRDQLTAELEAYFDAHLST